MAIGPGSAALDKADTTKCPAADQRGVQCRTDAACDIGAYEFVEAASAAPLLPRSGTPAPIPGTPIWPIAVSLLVRAAAAVATARTVRHRS